MKQIQWFPGHMKKTITEIEENLKIIDIILELRDARAPLSSENPQIARLIEKKKKIIILTKKDLADDVYTKRWITHFNQQGITAIAYDVHHDNPQNIVALCEKVLVEKITRDTQRGMKKRTMRVMVLGIPNVGKSTFINRLSKKKVTAIGNKPGITKTKQWIRIHKELDLLDTPGVLWPKFDDELVGYKLATLGTIKDTILPLDDVVFYAIDFLTRKYPGRLVKRYVGTNDLAWEKQAPLALLEDIAAKRGIIIQQHQPDFHQVMMTFLNELRFGKLGKITLDDELQ